MSRVIKIATLTREEMYNRKARHEKTGELKAYCTSIRCLGWGDKKHGVNKKVPKFADWCPDCGHALFWSRNVPEAETNEIEG